MPYQVTIVTLPCGSTCVRADGSGVITKEDGEHLMAIIGPDGSMFGVPILILAQRVEQFSAEARSLFASAGVPRERHPWCAVVTTNPLLRVAVNFMVRVTGNRTMRMCSTEEEALRWLDERAGQNVAK